MRILRCTQPRDRIETLEQAEVLKRFGCHVGQEFYFCRPVDAAALIERTLAWDEPQPASLVLQAS